MFIISHINDINEEKYRAIDNRIQNFIKNDFKYILGGILKTRALIITNIIITNNHNEFLNNMMLKRIQNPRYYKIHVGICTKEAKMYIYEDIKGFGYLYFDDCYKNLLKVLNLKKSSKIIFSFEDIS